MRGFAYFSQHSPQTSSDPAALVLLDQWPFAIWKGLYRFRPKRMIGFLSELGIPQMSQVLQSAMDRPINEVKDIAANDVVVIEPWGLVAGIL